MKYKIHSRFNREQLILYRTYKRKPTQIKYIYIQIHIHGFPYWGIGASPPTLVKKFCHSPHQKSTPNSPPPKQQFSSYNPIKTAFLAVVNAPAPFLF